jgi:cell division protein FtsI (penicillin-binding protein 3)
MMTAVVEDGGTGTEAAMDGYIVAGKTGTAQKSAGSKGYENADLFVASFFGFLPANKPKLVISVIIDEPLVSYYGGTVSAPAFKRIAGKAMRDMGISPDFTSVKRRKKRLHKVVDEVARDEDDIDAQKNRDIIKAASLSTPYQIALKKGEIRTPDLIGRSMKDVLKILAKKGLKPLFLGTGIAAEQIPSPGTPVSLDSYVQVNFTPLGRAEVK